MKRNLVFDIIFWVLTVLWCYVIFSFSAEKGETSSGTSGRVCRIVASIFVGDFETMAQADQQKIVENLQFFVRKTAHFTAYAVLGFLVSMDFRRKKFLKWLGFSTAFVCLYAISDEIHQLFVPERSGRALDVLIDAAGGVCGIVAGGTLLFVIAKLSKKRPKNNTL